MVAGGGGAALAFALAVARVTTFVLGAEAIAPAVAVAFATVATNGCCVQRGAGAALGWAGAGLAFATGGGAMAVPFVVTARSAEAAAEAVAKKVFLPMLFRTPEAAVAVWSIRRPTSVLISPPDLACATAAPSTLALSTFMRCFSGVGLGMIVGALTFFMIVLMVL